MEIEFPHARITGQNILYLMKTNTCLIGREVNSKVDILISTSPCISRTHLKLVWKSDKLYLKCLGKNGIFINESFQVYTLDEVPLPSLSTIRFPSTNIELQIESRSYLMDNCKKKFPFKKRLFIVSKNSDSLVCDDSYLSESSTDLHDTSSLKNDQSLVQNSADLIVHSPTDQGSETVKPPYSYAQLIIQAIVSGESQQMTLSEIYRFISRNFPFYKMNQKGWQNSIRHNLSLNRYFIRIPRSHNNCGKSAYWKLDKSQETQLIKQAFWKRRMKNAFIIVNKPVNNSNQNSNISYENSQLNSEQMMSIAEVQDSNSTIVVDQSSLSNESIRIYNNEISMYNSAFEI